MTQKHNLNLDVGMKGVVKSIELRRPDGSVRQKLGPFDNLITDAGLMAIRTTGSVTSTQAYRYCHLSTDTAQPSTATAIVKDSKENAAGAAPTGKEETSSGYYAITMVYAFAQGAAAGENISKLFFAGGAGGSAAAFSEVLIKGPGGGTTTITPTADDVVVVTWELRLYWPASDPVATLSNSGNKGGQYTITVRPVATKSAIYWKPPASASTLAIGFETRINGTYTAIYKGAYTLVDVDGARRASDGESSAINSSLDNTDPKITTKLTLGVGVCNWAEGIGGGCLRMLGSGGAWQFKIDPVIMKTSDDIVELSFTLTLGRK